MWAKNSTPSPGFLEGSLAQNTIQGAVERVDQGTTSVSLALSSDPLVPLPTQEDRHWTSVQAS